MLLTVLLLLSQAHTMHAPLHACLAMWCVITYTCCNVATPGGNRGNHSAYKRRCLRALLRVREMWMQRTHTLARTHTHNHIHTYKHTACLWNAKANGQHSNATNQVLLCSVTTWHDGGPLTLFVCPYIMHLLLDTKINIAACLSIYHAFIAWHQDQYSSALVHISLFYITCPLLDTKTSVTACVSIYHHSTSSMYCLTPRSI